MVNNSTAQHIDFYVQLIKHFFLDKHENYINLTQENNIYSIPVRAGKHFIQWSIDVDAHPIVQNVWYNNKNKEIYTNAKYNISDTDTQAIIKIYDITINDRGYYTLNSSNGYETKEVKLFLNVTGNVR